MEGRHGADREAAPRPENHFVPPLRPPLSAEGSGGQGVMPSHAESPARPGAPEAAPPKISPIPARVEARPAGGPSASTTEVGGARSDSKSAVSAPALADAEASIRRGFGRLTEMFGLPAASVVSRHVLGVLNLRGAPPVLTSRFWVRRGAHPAGKKPSPCTRRTRGRLRKVIASSSGRGSG
jgi:hypothetical protein